MRIKKGLVGLISMSLLAGAALAPASVAAQDDDVTIYAVVHGQAQDAFWTVVGNAFDDAAEAMGVDVVWSYEEKFDVVTMAQKIEAAVAAKPDGLIVSIPDVDAISPPVQAAVEAGIPVITINSGSDVYEQLGAMTHIGQTEYEAGFGGGERMAAAGAVNAICFNQEVGNAALDLRCDGFTDAFEAAGGKVTLLSGEIGDPTGMQNTVLAAIQGDSTIDAVMTLGPSAALPIFEGLKDADLIPGIKMATFDLDPDILQAIADGEFLFAIDQQQYLQGYLPVVILALHARYGGLTPGGGEVILTGPGFVTQENAAAVIELSAQGIR
jgi:simple sugar transport system substrate-binding protein